MTKNLMAYNRNEFPHSSGGHKCKISFTELQSRCCRPMFLLQAIEENLFSCFLQFLEDASIPWRMVLCHPVSASIVISHAQLCPPAFLS